MNSLQYYSITCFEKVMQFKKEIGIGIGVIVLGILGYFGYGYYQQKMAILAHKEFVSAMRVFDAPLKSEGKRVRLQDIVFETADEKWNRVFEAFERGYKNNKSSPLAGMFLAYQAEALIQLNRREDAIELLRQAVERIVGEQIRKAYLLKLALVEMDSKKGEIASKGFERLQAIALDANNCFADAALFHLGLYFFVKKQFADAKNYWGQLKIKYAKEQDADKGSVWAQRALEKLKLFES